MMKTRLHLFLVLICTLLALVLATGCVNQPQAGNPAVTPVPTDDHGITPSSTIPVPGEALPAPAQVYATVPAESLPTDISLPPPRFATDIRIDKDRVYSTITVTFVGGPGQVFVRDILVRVTRSDGLKEEKHIPFKDQVPVGASVDLAGTKGSDRVEVYVTINGVTYKIRDENAVYEQY
ncbi:MAG TPA: hypothetical protein VMC42_04500 [Methanoregulaceae archaeon]|nr:hypothetical protein [Methanoregulaceae archaeon]